MPSDPKTTEAFNEQLATRGELAARIAELQRREALGIGQWYAEIQRLQSGSARRDYPPGAI